MSRSSTTPIAIVGMACRYPDARSPRELWQMALAGRRAFRRIPEERLRLSDYVPRGDQDPDSIYPIEAALIEDYSFDRGRFRVPAATFAAADMTHWLALDVASQALEDAGFPDGAGLPRDETGVVIGNTLTGEFSRAALMRNRWPYVRRVVAGTLAEDGMEASRRETLLERLEESYKAPFAEPNEESLAGGLSNTIAGRICNHYGLRGGGFTVDGACAASLVAVATACAQLAGGQIDVALAGAVDLSIDPFELVGFARNGALAPEEMRVFDARAAGFWPGEGCGVVVLMRRADAVRGRKRIYATIRGWGFSTDGHGGLTRPTVEGQALAMQRAWRMAGFGAGSVPYFEAHGTGTAVGDPTELASIAAVRREGATFPAVVGSIKANIGHTKAAAGLAGLIKATMALSERALPPGAGREQPHPAFVEAAEVLATPGDGRAWPRALPLRAGVSSMGFGGINTHLALEGEGPRRKRALDDETRRLLATPQDAELFLFDAPDRETLVMGVERLAKRAPALSRAELSDAAAALAARLGDGRWRAAVVAASSAELAARLAKLRRVLAGDTANHIDARGGVFFGHAVRPPRIAFFFPGQAAPANRDGGLWRRRFAAVDARYLKATLPEGDAGDTAIAQPAIVTASLAGLDVLNRLGVSATVAVGHSLGELVALAWAGAITEATLMRLVRARGQAMRDHALPGAMASLAASADEVDAIVGTEQAVIACYNAPREQVVSGGAEAIARVIERAAAAGISAQRLPVANAFHTELMAPSVAPFAQALARERLNRLQRPVVSTVTGALFDPRTDLRAHLAAQIRAPVRFADAARGAARDADLILEVGPGRILSRLAGELTEQPAIALDAGGASLAGLLAAVGAAFVLAGKVRIDALFADRFTRAFDLERPRTFLANPCEQAPTDTPPAPRPARAPTPVVVAPAAGVTPLDVLRRVIARRLELPVAVVSAQHRLLGDLHLSSIEVGRVIAEAARELGTSPPRAPTEFANITVAVAAEALVERKEDRETAAPSTAPPAGVDAWVRCFETVLEPAPLRVPTMDRPVAWRVVAPDRHPLGAALRAACGGKGTDADGIAFCLPPDPSPADATLLLQTAQAALTSPACKRFLLVQHDGGGGGFARTLSLEAPHLAVALVDVPADLPYPAAIALTEGAAADRGFTEVRYTGDGKRYLPTLEARDTTTAPASFAFGADDVVLVSGGGKGIGAECALALTEGTDAHLVLLGRSPEHDPVLVANLARMRAAGRRVDYVRADVGARFEVRAALDHINHTIGQVTAFLHAAGSNRPARITALDAAALSDALHAKWHGARNVLGQLDPQRLRLLVGFGSIIARIGLEGEAHYALANGWLARLIDDHARRNPHCRCLTLEWSVWAGTGMGERLGVLDALSERGVAAISTDDGVAMLRRLVADPSEESAVIVAGRFGLPPTVRLKDAQLPLLRFLERPLVHYPKVELVAESVLSADTDPYLADHVLSGSFILPGVFCIEAMAQAAAALAPDAPMTCVTDLAFREAIAAEPGERVTLRVAALRRTPRATELALRCSSTRFQSDHARAVFGFAELEADAAPAAISGRTDFDAATDLYGRMLFHGQRFRRIAGYRLLTARECIAEIKAGIGKPWLGAFLPSTLLLGDPGVRDAALHALQACIPHRRVLPVGAARIEAGRLTSDADYIVTGRERVRSADRFTFDFEIRDPGGAVVERWFGLELQAIEPLPQPSSWPVSLAAAYLERRLNELLGEPVHIGLAEGRAEALALAGIDPDLVQQRPDGKPLVSTGAPVSIAHTPALTLAVSAAAGSIGCDMQAVQARGDDWRDLLGNDQLALARLIREHAGDDFDTAATRVWTALECQRKANMRPSAPLLLDALPGNGWLMLRAGEASVASAVVTMRGIGRIAVAVLRAPSPTDAVARRVLAEVK